MVVVSCGGGSTWKAMVVGQTGEARALLDGSATHALTWPHINTPHTHEPAPSLAQGGTSGASS